MLLFLAFILAFGLTYFAIPVIISIASKRKLADPVDDRKIHDGGISALGGVGIAGGFLVALLLTGSNFESGISPCLLAGCLLLLAVGITDDLVGVSPRNKLMAQFLAVGLLFIPYLPGLIAWPFSFIQLFVIAGAGIGIVFYINSFNCIDGINGLAGSIGVVSSLILAVSGLVTNNASVSLAAFSLCGGLIAFLIYNFNNASIFMGDNGSLSIGFLISGLSFEIFYGMSVSEGLWDYGLMLVVCISFIPVVDLARTAMFRILSGKSPFHADRTHLHHLLLNYGWHPVAICLVVCSLQIILFLSVHWNAFGVTLLAIMFCIPF